MKKRLIIAALFALTLVLGFAAGTASRIPLHLAPLSAEDREALVDYFRGTAALNRRWGFYNAINERELNWWNTRADVFDTAALWLENLPFPSQAELSSESRQKGVAP